VEKKTVAVLDFGSGKLLGFVAEANPDGSAVLLKARAENPYDGFYDGEWLDKQNAKEIIVKTLKQLENQAGRSVGKIYAGVPGEFSVTAVRKAEVKFNSPHKINSRDISGLFDSADNFQSTPGYKPISASSAYFVLDGSKKTVNPLGMLATSAFAAVSFSFADKKFCSFVEGIVKKFGIGKVEFISNCLSQALYLFTEAERERPCVLVDVGYVTTSVSVILGDGLLYSRSFSMGSGHITDDLSQVLEIDYDAADELRKKVNLNLDFSEEDTYSSGGASVSAIKGNEIVAARIEDIAERIVTCLDESRAELCADTLIYLSGGGFFGVQGGVKCLQKFLGRRIMQAPFVVPEFDKAGYNSGYGLLAAAIKQEAKSRGFLARLLGLKTR